ncbi:uncharacterized protein [Primulina huaijiensis]|uniref:uncharacterized protein n=1 Tax=Primulina huaijiensis TaxID=1492673 RepID=UPI003CC73874
MANANNFNDPTTIHALDTPVSKEIFGGIVYSTEASFVWTDLKDQFDKVNGSRIFALHRDIGRLVQDYCFRLNGYPPGHKLYKPQQGKSYSKKFGKEFQKSKKVQREANLVEEGFSETPQSSTPIGAQNFTAAQYAEILKLLGNSNLQSATQPVVNMAGNNSNLLHVSHAWIVDTGANEHVVGDISLLQNSMSIADSTKSVRMPNGSQTYISKIGTVPITNTLTLENDLKTGRIMGIGREEGGLYHFAPNCLPTQKLNLFPFETTFATRCNTLTVDKPFIAQSSIGFHDWHKQLGHMSFLRMKLLPFISNIDALPHCSICPMSKQSRIIEISVIHSIKILGGLCVDSSLSYQDRTPTPVLNHKTPFEILFHKPPAFEHLRTFGCLCYASILPVGHMFYPRAARCAFLGYSTVQKGYKVLDLHTKRVFFSKDVTFHENIFPFVSEHSQAPIFPCPTPFVEDSSTSVTTSEISTNPPLRRSSRTTVPPIWLKDFSCSQLPKANSAVCSYPISKYLTYSNFSPSYQDYLAAMSSVTEPNSYHEAITDPRWQDAMNLELAALE